MFSEKVPKEVEQQLGHIEITKEKPLFYQKALCFISHYSYISQYKELLKHIYRLHLSKNQIPIERIVCNIVDDIQLPVDTSEWGKVHLSYNLFGSLKSNIVFSTCQKYPVVSQESLKILFRVLDIEKIIFLFECVLLEKKIFIISNHKSLITHVTEALISLIYPFQWNHVLIPILPDNLKSYTEAPVPFIIGINQNSLEISQPMQSESIQAYIDSNDLINIESLPSLPEKPYKQLKKRLLVYEKINQSLSTIQEFIEQSDNAFCTVLFEEDTFDQ